MFSSGPSDSPAQRIFDGAHAANDAEGYYGQLVRAARVVNRVALAAHIPVTIAVDALIKDPIIKRDILQILNAVELMSAAPLISELGTASLSTFRQAPDRSDMWATVGKEVGKEALMQAVPLIESILRKIRH